MPRDAVAKSGSRSAIGSGRWHTHRALTPSVIVWLTGLPGAGKTTLARALQQSLVAQGREVEVLDGDELRATLSADLGFSRADRDTQVKRTAFVARLLAKHRVTVIVALVSPYAQARDAAKAEAEAEGLRFLVVHVDAPRHTLISRDPKGLYRRALAGEVKHVTGIDDPYEAPSAPALRIDSSQLEVAAAVQLLQNAIS